MMKDEILLLNILAILFSGLSLVAAAVGMLLFKDVIRPYFRYLLPIPPISVAVYVFVFNLFKDGGGRGELPLSQILLEVGKATLMASLSFFWIALSMAFVIKILMKIK